MRLLFACLLLVGCAHGKMGTVDQPLGKGIVSKDVEVLIEPISAKDMAITGDKSTDNAKVTAERAEIEQTYNSSIANWLTKKGYKARAVTTPSKTGLVLVGNVVRFEHGSAAARYFGGGFGAGSSNMFTNFQLVDKATGKVLSKFEVIATSGGTGGLGSYLKEHMDDGAAKVAEYIDTSNK